MSRQHHSDWNHLFDMRWEAFVPHHIFCLKSSAALWKHSSRPVPILSCNLISPMHPESKHSVSSIFSYHISPSQMSSTTCIYPPDQFPIWRAFWKLWSVNALLCTRATLSHLFVSDVLFTIPSIPPFFLAWLYIISTSYAVMHGQLSESLTVPP